MGGLTRRLAEDREIQRRLRDRKGHTETKTFLVGGAIEAGLYVPPFFVGVDYDNETPEWKVLSGFRGLVRSGQVEVDLKLNGTTVLPSWWIGTDPTTSIHDFPEPLHELANGDVVQIAITAIDGDAEDLAAAVFMVTAAR